MSDEKRTDQETVDDKSGDAAVAGPGTTPTAALPAGGGDSMLRLVVTLMVVALVAAAALAGAHDATKDRIKAARARVRLQAISRVLPACDNNPVKDAVRVTDRRGNETQVYRCRKKQPDGSAPVVAVAIERDSSANKHKTYSGLMQVLVGIDAKTGKVRTFKRKGADDVGVVILKHSETPGLGSKAEDYDFRKAFAGKDLKDDRRSSGGKVWAVGKDDPEGFVDAISGATITSRAVTELVHEALVLFKARREVILTKNAEPETPAQGPRPAQGETQP